MADRRRSILSIVTRALAALAIASSSVSAQLINKNLPEPAEGVEVVEKLDAQIPRPIMLQRSDGMAVDFWDSLDDGKPVILVLGYYDCPLICPLTFQTLVEVLSDVDFTVGEDFRVVAVSFDHTNTTEDAEAKRQLSLLGYDREITPTIDDGFVFTIGSESNARRLADAVGYRYKELSNGEYSHPVALVILTPDGRVSRYIYSFDYKPRELKLALLEATEGKIGKSIGDYFLHLCFSFNSSQGKYTLAAFRVMQIVGALTVVLLGGFIGGMFLVARIRRGKKTSSEPALAGRPTGAAT